MRGQRHGAGHFSACLLNPHGIVSHSIAGVLFRAPGIYRWHRPRVRSFPAVWGGQAGHVVVFLTYFVGPVASVTLVWFQRH